MKRKKSSKPGKQKRMRMKSSRESVAESNAEEPVGLSPSQPSPGSSRGRSGFRRVSPGLCRRMDQRRW